MSAIRHPRHPGDGPTTVYTRMGQLLGEEIVSEADALRLVKVGVPTRRYVLLVQRLQLAPGAIGAESTLRRRIQTVKSPGQRRHTRHLHEKPEPRLTPAESERLIRLTRVVSEATELFGDESMALNWLNTPGDFLHDDHPVTPMKLAESDSGARLVEALIQRTAHGVF